MPTRRRFIAAGLATSLLPLMGQAQQSPELQWLFDITAGTTTESAAALTAISDSKRQDMTAGLILALRFVPERDVAIVKTLRELTGERKAKDWFDWMLWQEKHPEFEPHPSFVDFMRDIYLRIDPEFDTFLRPDYLTRKAAKI